MLSIGMDKRQLYEWMHKHQPDYGNANHGKGSERWCKGFASVLDVGGGFTSFACDLGIERAAVVDISELPRQTQEARGVEFRRCAAHELPFADSAFELVTAFDVLEHVEPELLDASIASIFRVASRRVIISVGTRETHKVIDGLSYKLHETVESKAWWLRKLSKFGEILRADKFIVCKGIENDSAT